MRLCKKKRNHPNLDPENNSIQNSLDISDSLNPYKFPLSKHFFFFILFSWRSRNRMFINRCCFAFVPKFKFNSVAISSSVSPAL